jgi:signal peptidase I
LLTFFGWGVGFYYARSKAAWPWAFAQIIASVAIGVVLVSFAYYVSPTILRMLGAGDGPSLAFTLLLNVPVAIVAWIVAARRTEVQPAGAGRLFGYLLIWLVPMILSVALAMSFRFTLFQPFRMPSGSMQPTLHVGDYFIVSKSSYGYSRYSAAPFESLLPPGRYHAREPQRGDVVVFRPEPEPDRDFVKRVVGLPGDRIQMVDGQLTINGQAVAREDLGVHAFVNEDGFTEQVQEYREALPNGVSYLTFDRTPRGELDNTSVYVVPPGHYFMLGDDRDNSADSRVPSVVGYVPFDNLIGRVDLILASGAHSTD